MSIEDGREGLVSLVDKMGREVPLAMQQLWLGGRILPVGASLVVRHVFQIESKKPAEVVYAFMLPRDAAMRRFTVTGKNFSITSELKKTKEAIQSYEAGVQKGNLSALVRQYRDGVINLSLGNLRPKETVTVLLELVAGVETRDDGFRFRFPFTLAPGYHPRARGVESGPGRGELVVPEAEFGDVMLPEWRFDGKNLHEIGFDLEVWSPSGVSEVASPSHSIRVAAGANGPRRVRMADIADVPNRDLVLEVRSEKSDPILLSARGGDDDASTQFIAVVPSTQFGAVKETPRRVVFVLDHSGSMDGCILKALRSLEVCLATLSPKDLFGIVAFSNSPTIFKSKLVPGGAKERAQAKEFLEGIYAKGGTALSPALDAAIALLGKDGGDIMLITDGQVMGSESILQRLPKGCVRIHCLGIGSASQDRFLLLLARSTLGVSRFMTPGERVDLAAAELFAAIRQPVAVQLSALISGEQGDLAPEPSSVIYQGSPLVVYGSTPNVTSLALALSWLDSEGASRKISMPLIAGESKLYETLRVLQGARLLTDLEGQYTGDVAGGQLKQKKAMERLSTMYGLASREMSLVAVIQRKGDKPDTVPETMVVPVGLPAGLNAGAYFGASPDSANGELVLGMSCCIESSPAMFSLRAPASFSVSSSRACRRSTQLPRDDMDDVMGLVALLEPDGGMPGRDAEHRLLLSVITLIVLMKELDRSGTSAFGPHIKLLRAFLTAQVQDPALNRRKSVVDRALKTLHSPACANQSWISLAHKGQTARDTNALWSEVGSKL